MKTETKISNIALVCALCAVVAAPASAAAPVRSLGGAGTYSSASSAATSKATGSTATSTRAGAMRVLPSTTKATTSATTTAKPVASATTSTRVTATPRLSLGKYLAGNRVVSSKGPEVDTVVKEDLESHLADYERLAELVESLGDQIEALDGAIGETNITELQTIVNDLQTNVTAIENQLPADGEEVATAESVTNINNTVTNINTTIENLKTQIEQIEAGSGDNSTAVAELEQSVGVLQGDITALKSDVLAVQGEFVKYVLKSDYQARSEKVDADIISINSAAADLATRIDVLERKTDDGVASEGDFTELQKTVAQLQSSLESMADQLPDDGTAAVTQSQIVAVQGEIDAISEIIPESGIASVADVDVMKKNVADLQTSVSELDGKLAQTVLKETYETAVDGLESDIAEIYVALENYYTKGQVDTAIANAVKPVNDWLTEERRGAVELALINLEAMIGAKTEIGEYVTVAELQKVKSDLESIITGGDANDGLVYESDLAALDAKLTALMALESDSVIKTTLATIQSNLETSYYTKDQVDEKFANLEITADQITSINATSIQGKITTEQIDSLDASKITGQIQNGQLADGVITADKISTSGAVLANGDLAMLVSDGNGGVSWASVGVVTDEDGN